MPTVLRTTQTLNIKGMKCPMPVVWASNMLHAMKPGETLEIVATDPGAIQNFKSFARSTGNAMLDWSESGGVVRVVLRKGEDADSAKGTA